MAEKTLDLGAVLETFAHTVTMPVALDIEADRVLALSFWNTLEDAERYQQEQYPKIKETLSHLLETVPVIRTFDVHTSTRHKVAAGKAAWWQRTPYWR